MPHGLFQRSKELFQNAEDLPQEARASYLDQACGADEALRAEVEALLAAAREASSFLEHDAQSLIVPMLAQEAKVSLAGRRIGPFRLERELGRGGMGVVYLAQRVEGEFEQKVAIKLVHRDLATAEMQRRLRRERQTLAALDHPHIARLFDGGVTEDVLYFVMEHVEGQPLDAYCDDHKLDTRARLTLFLKVCEAVKYAHRYLIVHRDLKPGNILVTKEGVPKLLDFGIAKLLHQDGTEQKPGDTMTGQQPMTPHYASPEQARDEAISTVSDVYALGVILYQLLTGHQPYHFASTSPAEIARVICDTLPEKPSTVIDKKEKEPITPESVSAVREGSVEKLRQRLAGDLDNIVLKALRKEPDQRYGSVEQFADDITRHLEGRPVHARKGTWSYRASRFVRRHKYAVTAASIFFALVLGFGVVTKVQANRIALERDKAEQVSKFLVEIFQVSDPNEARGDTITVREILDRGADKIATELKEQPLVQAALMNTIGRVYQNLGFYDRATTLLERTLETRQQALGEVNLEVAESLNALAQLWNLRADHATAERLCREALALRRQLLGEENLPVAESLNILGSILQNQAKQLQADTLYNEALTIRRKLLGNEHPSIAESMHQLGAIKTDLRNYNEAESYYRGALALREKLYGREHPLFCQSLNALGSMLIYKGDFADAESLLSQNLELRRKVLGNEHPDVATSLGNLAAVLRMKGNLVAAEPLYREALAQRRKLLGDKHKHFMTSLGNLAALLVLKGDFAEAESLYLDLLAKARMGYADKPRELATMLNMAAGFYYARGVYEPAVKLYREALEIRRRFLAADDPLIYQIMNNLAYTFFDKGDLDEAEKQFRWMMELRAKVLSKGPAFVASSLTGFGGLLLDKNDLQKAEALLREGLHLWQEKVPKGSIATLGIAETENSLGGCLTRLRRYHEAESLLVKSYPNIKAGRGEKHAHTLKALSRIVDFYHLQNKPTQAAEYRAQLPKPESVTMPSKK